MKKSIFCILYLILGMLGLISCSNGEENIDDVLSKETTYVKFELGNNYNYYFFDYTEGGTFVGSDTIENTHATINLRQGKHQLIWIKGLYGFDSPNEDSLLYTPGIHYIPKNKTLAFIPYKINRDTAIEYNKAARNEVYYWKKNLEVSSYLLPTQKVDFLPLTCSIKIELTDGIRFFDISYTGNGMITNIPIITGVGLEDNRYSINAETACETIDISGVHICSLCPLDGLKDIQLTCEIKDGNGLPYPTTLLPKFSIRRGYTTKLSGPLFSGSTSDWTVEMKPYE